MSKRLRTIIFGAQGYALGTYTAIKNLYPEREMLGFVVSSMVDNAPILGGAPVRELADFSGDLSDEEKDSIEVIIATPESVQEEIALLLKNYGYNHVKKLDSEYWNELMSVFHAREHIFMPLKSMPKGIKAPVLKIYLAKHHKDKPLRNVLEIKDYMHFIQVGAVCCDSRIAELADDVGENISSKNPNYCELTGLYWIWKRFLSTKERFVDGEYVGFAQYRRILVLSDEDLLRLEENDVDVVLPFPLLYEPDIGAHHDRYISKRDWDVLLDAVKRVHPDYFSRLTKILEQQYLYNYNVILAKENVLSDYCEWLFPILEVVEELSVPKGDERSDRYIGYMAETLETLYFRANADKLKIAHVGVRMLT